MFFFSIWVGGRPTILGGNFGGDSFLGEGGPKNFGDAGPKNLQEKSLKNSLRTLQAIYRRGIGVRVKGVTRRDAIVAQ